MNSLTPSPSIAVFAATLAAACGDAPQVVRPGETAKLGASVRALIEERAADAERAPRDPEGHGLLALVYESNEIWPEAVRAYGAAARLDPEDPVWPYHAAICRYAGGEPETALAEIDAVIARFPSCVQALHRRGEWRLVLGDLDGAEADFEATAGLQPRLPQGHVGLGAVAIERGDAAAAAALLEHALDLDPSYRVAHFLLGRAYRRLGRLDEAQREQALGLEAEVVFLGDRLQKLADRAKVGLTVAIDDALEHLGAGRFDQAVAVLERARGEYPSDTRLLNNLAIAYGSVQKSEQQLEALEAALEIDEGEIGTWINLVNAYLTVGRPDDALAAAGRAIQIDGASAQAYFAQGRALLATGRVPEAYEPLKRAIRYGPQLYQAHAALSEACMILGRVDEAREHLEELARRLPNDLVTFVNLGETCLVQNDVRRAREAYEAAQRIAPGHPRVQKLGRKIEERGR